MDKRLSKKLLAILMIITILATDFFVLGSSLITYAAQINSETNNPNIEFSAYFKETTTRTDSIEKSIKSGDLKLYAEIKVKNEGYFNGTIEAQNSNFDIVSSNIGTVEGNKVSLKQINAGETVEIELGIKPIITDKITTDFLSKISTVKLTGTYIYSQDEKGENIQAEKEVCVNYIVDETAEAELTTDIITNKVFSLKGTNKRIVQLLIKSRLSENQYPIKQTTLNVNIPELSTKSPEEVNVLAIGKLATNGLIEIGTNNWVNENGVLQITLNNEVDSNNEISWNKNIYDELVVTFIYAEDVDASKVEITTNSEIKLHNLSNIYTATYTKGIENQELNNIITGKTEITTEEIYKGQLYAKIDTLYNTDTTLIVANPNIVDEVVINEGPDAFETGINEISQTTGQNTKYLTTEINLNKMLEILGEHGNIQIKNGETITVINKESTVNEDGNVIIKHENSTERLEITTSKPSEAGILEIKHQKVILGNNVFSNTRERLQALKGIKSNISVVGTITINKEKQKIVENFTEASIELKETVSKAELTVDKRNLSTTEANEVILGVKLITDGTQYDLYKNPTINIKLPSVVETVELIGKPNKLYADEFEISSEYDETNKIIKINLTGEQTTYPESSATQLYLQLKLNITLSKLATTQTNKIMMAYTNQNASQYSGGTNDCGIVEQEIGISAPTGLIKIFNLSSNENSSLTETITQLVTGEDVGKEFNFETVLVNNTDSDINNIRILGKLPTTGNKIDGKDVNTLETTLKNVVAPNATIYYTENVDATTDIEDTTNAWTTNLAELKNAKLYLIKLATLSKASNYTATINIQIPSLISKNVLSHTQYEVIYDTETKTDIKESSREITLMTSLTAELETTLTAQVGQDTLNNGDTVKEGEVIKYIVTVKNGGSQVLENVQLKASVPEGTVFVQPTEDYVYATYYYDEKEDKEISEFIKLAPGEIYTKQYEVRVNNGAAGKEISNKSVIIYDNSSIESKEINNRIEEANIRVTIKRADDENIQLIPEHSANYVIYVENLSDKKITDLQMNIETEEINVTSIRSVNNIVNLYDENITKVDIREMLANEVLVISITGKIKKDIDKSNISINVVDSNGIKYRSNVNTEIYPYTNATITLSSPQNNAYIKTGDKVEYNIVVENTGDIAGRLTILDEISECLEIEAVYINKQLVVQTTDSTNEATYQEVTSNDTINFVELQPGQKAELDIIAKAIYIPNEGETKVITNKAEVEFLSVKKGESLEVKHMLINNSTAVEDVKNVISGFVWGDINENGQKDNTEKYLEGITVKLYNNTTKKYLTDEDGNVIQKVSNKSGEYVFSKVEDGQYIVVFEYNKEKYEPTVNSRIKLINLTVDEKEVEAVGTELINVQGNITDLNISLKEKIEDSKNPGNSETSKDPTNPGDNEENKKIKTISGLAWVDEDRDGKKDSSETELSGIKVRIYSVSTKNYLKDSNGNIVETATDKTGKYIFENIEKGEYIILFEYDMEEYEPTEYMAEGVETTLNSKVVLKKIEVNGEEKTFAVTDKIKVQENVSNINIGLKENLIFDLELNKYISRIVVQNSKDTKSYDYENKTFGKVEIHRKQVNGSLVVLEYTIKVKNTGEITGYAKNIVDYLPSGLTFSSELNRDWYLSGNYLHTKGLENLEIKPGEEKEVKLILTKTMTNENVGLINNRAEIYQDYNKYGETDIDSTPNNQTTGEDDIGSVDVIVGISTGGGTTASYLILLMINAVLIGFAIKLMIRNKIIRLPNKRRGRR